MNEPAEDTKEENEAVPVGPEARRTARRLARMVDRVTRDLPFGAEPSDYLVVRDRLAEREPDGDR